MATLINRYSGAVWLRNCLTWRRMIWSSMASNVANPLIFLIAFGFGLGSFIETIDGLPYLAFVHARHDGLLGDVLFQFRDHDQRLRPL